jgi:HEAT repeat protein
MRGDPNDVAARIAPFLDDSHGLVRSEAGYWLGYCASRRQANITGYVDGILRLADEPEPEAKQAVLTWLEYIPTSAVAKADLVTTMLADSSPEVVRDAARFVGKASDGSVHAQAIPQLMQALPRRDCSFLDCCKAIATIGPPAASELTALHKLAEESDPFEAVYLAEAIWRISGDASQATPILIRSLTSGHIAAPEAACDALYYMGAAATQAVPSVIEVLASSDNYDLNWAITDALGAIGMASPEALNQLEAQLEHPSPIVQSSALGALARVGPTALPRLEAILNSTPWWHARRRRAVKSAMFHIRACNPD